MKVLRAPTRAVAVLVVLSFVPTLSAAQSPVVSITERMRGASTVVVARVESVAGQWMENEQGDRVIVSKVLLRVEEALKGTPAQVEWLDLEGGSVDGITLQVSSLPVLHTGERAVFFLDRATNGPQWRPHLRGLGILKLDDRDTVGGGAISLDDIRGVARQSGN